MKKSHFGVVLGAVTVAGAFALCSTSASSAPEASRSGCDISTSGPAPDAEHSYAVVVEQVGNSQAAAEDAAEVVTDALTPTLQDAHVPISVKVVMVRNGKVDPAQKCINTELRLAGDSNMTAAYSKATPKSKRVLDEEFVATRTKQIGKLAEAAAEHVLAGDFSESGDTVVVSTAGLWQIASKNTPVGANLVVAGSMQTTAADCLFTDDPARLIRPGMRVIDNLVDTCARTTDLPQIDATVTVVVSKAVTMTGPQTQAAAAVADALCRRTTTNCNS